MKLHATGNIAAGSIRGAGILLYLCIVIVISTVRTYGATDSSCKKCGATVLPYPFGLDASCGLPEFRLKCRNESLLLPLNSKNYEVLNITSNTISIDPLSTSSCNESNFRTFNLTGFHNYWVSSNNTLVLYSCNSTKSCPLLCPFPQRRKGNQSCTPATCCYKLKEGDIYMGKNDSRGILSELECTTFTSWVVDSQTSEDELQVTYGLELNWVVSGNCTASAACSHNATCVQAINGPGHTCQCNDGFRGDGYLNGCIPATVVLPNCNTTISTNCTCQTPLIGGLCPPQHKKKVTRVLATSGGVAAGALLVGAVCLAVLLRRHIKRKQARHCRREMKELARLFSLGEGTTATTLFSYKELEKATKGFSADEKLGGGAFGTVYAGKLQDGQLVAVKRINAGSNQGIEQVVNEVNVLSAVNHTNLVQLLGCCLELQDSLLVYEYVPNGTLTEHLQCERGGVLDWQTRIRIATETARALAYLHSTVNPPIYHRDVKSSNILLDFNFNTKVADFGLSRTAITEGTHISTGPQGTPGYLDPEYHQYFHLSDKSDVYSFGVVLIEIITAMKVVDFSRDRREVNLACLALIKITSGCLDEIIDPHLETDKRPLVRSMVHRVAELAFRCLSMDKDTRPPMLEVLDELELIQIASLASNPGNDELDDFPASPDLDSLNAHKLQSVSPISVHQHWSSNTTSPADSIRADL